MYDNSTLAGLALSVRKTNNIDGMYSNVGDDQHIRIPFRHIDVPR